jgi:hypothetical protein
LGLEKMQRLWFVAGGFAVAAVFYIVLALLGIGCPVHALTGIPCAGCGMTRAYLSLLHLDFRGAFFYHPLFWMVPLVVLTLLVRKGPLARPKLRLVLWSVFVVLTIGVYLLRLLVFKDSAIYLFAA